jgi:hypothetical protein
LIARGQPAAQPTRRSHPSSEVDEAHGYKNLATVSNIRAARIEGSKRASDLHMKLE